MKQDHVRAFGERQLYLIEAARRVAPRGISYRDFQVGCALLAWSDHWGREIVASEGDGEPTIQLDGTPYDTPYRYFHGSNLLLEKGGPKVCAEMQAIGAARSAGAQVIVGIVVAGEPQHDDVSGLNPPTLHPCYNCRYFLKHLPEVKIDTIVVTVCNHSGPTERHTVRELLDKHQYHQR